MTGPHQAGIGSRMRAGDLWGGLAAVAVLLPQAMAFGVALYALAGLDAAGGAYAGLLGTALLCVATGLAGGTRGLISAPTGPSLVLLGGAAAALTGAGLQNTQLLLGLAAVTVAAGVFQFLIGITGGGRLIKYIPFPVVSGFMTGSAILMVASQMKPLTATGVSADWDAWVWLPAVAAVATMGAAYGVTRVVRWIPGPVAGLIVGTLLFHLIASFNGSALPDIWLIGALPKVQALAYDVSVETLRILPWGIILPAALALAVLALLDTLLTAVIADVATGTRHDSRRELMGQGCGQVLSGLFGGMAGAGTTAATIVAIKSGGYRWVGTAAGIAFFILVSVAGDIGRILPISVLAGIILYVAIGMVDLDILAWLKRKRLRQDAVIALLVTAITVFYDLMIAVGVGVAIAIVLFIREEIKSPVVHRRSTAKQTHSIRQRTADERELLDRHGDRIILYELRGNLFFGTADRLFEELMSDLDDPNWIILHMRKVTQIDLTAIRFLRQIASRLNNHGGTLIFCNVHKGAGVGRSIQKTFKKISAGRARVQVLTFNGKDEALDFAENALLEELGHAATQMNDEVPLAENDLCRSLSADEIAYLGELLITRTCKKGEKIFSTADIGDELYIVLRGQVDIRLPTTKHHYKRLASCGPGTFFGELALLNPGPRAANAVTVRKTTLLGLNRAAFEKLQQDHPATAINLLTSLCETQVAQQRWSVQEMQRLSEW
jgi:SulP family sulfate permease